MVEDLEKKTTPDSQDRKMEWKIKNGIKPCFWKITLNTQEKIDRDIKENDSRCIKCDGYNPKCPNYYVYDVQEK